MTRTKKNDRPLPRPLSFEAHQHGWGTDDPQEIKAAIDRAVRGTLGLPPRPRTGTGTPTDSGQGLE